MENYHFSWENSLSIVIFHSYVQLPEGIGRGVCQGKFPDVGTAIVGTGPPDAVEKPLGWCYWLVLLGY
jgi:hypothetical protein